MPNLHVSFFGGRNIPSGNAKIGVFPQTQQATSHTASYRRICLLNAVSIVGNGMAYRTVYVGVVAPTLCCMQ